MRKNGSRLISLKQYRLTDLFLFAVILVVFDLIAFYAPSAFGKSVANFTFSLVVPLTLTVMIRWGWPSVFFGMIDGALFCLLRGLGWQSYLAYVVGNSLIMLLLIIVKLAGWQKIAGKWYFSALFVVLGWAVVVLGRTSIAAICGQNFVDALLSCLAGDLLSAAVGVIVVLVLRRLDGMFENQKHYLKRLDDERRELSRRDEFGDEPVEIDDETMSILRRHDDDLYK